MIFFSYLASARQCPIVPGERTYWTQNMIEECWMFNLMCALANVTGLMPGTGFQNVGGLLFAVLCVARVVDQISHNCRAFCSHNHQQISHRAAKQANIARLALYLCGGD